MGIWQTIKNFFKSDESVAYRKFAKPPVINFKEIEKHGKTDANLSIELSNDSLPTILNRSAHLLHNFHLSQYELAQRYFTESQKSADSALNDANIDDTRTRLYNLTKNSDELNLNQRETEVKALHQDFLDTRENYRNFKRQNGISLLPKKNADPEQTKFQRWLVVFLLVIEFVLNFVVLQGGGATDGGAALGISVSQTLINILTCYFVGKILIGRIIFFSMLHKFFYGIIVLIHAYLILLVNANMGIFRKQISEASQSSNIDELFGTNLLGYWENFPWDKLNGLPTDAILVIGMGIVFALGAYLDGFLSDDPYPGYGAVYRQPLKLKRLIESKISSLNETWTAQLRQYNAMEGRASKRGLNGIKAWSHEINSIEQVKDDYKALLVQLEKTYDQMIKLYVGTYNRFHTSAQIEIKNLNLLADSEKNIEHVFSDTKDYFMNDKDRLAKEEAKKKKFASDFESLKKELKQINDNISSEIKALSTNYPLDLN